MRNGIIDRAFGGGRDGFLIGTGLIIVGRGVNRDLG